MYPRLNSRTFFVNNVPKQRVCELNEEMNTALNVSCTALMGIHAWVFHPFQFCSTGWFKVCSSIFGSKANVKRGVSIAWSKHGVQNGPWPYSLYPNFVPYIISYRHSRL